MINEEMLEFIRSSRTAGMGDIELGHLLIAEGGWNQSDVDEAFRALLLASPPPVDVVEVVPAPPAPPSLTTSLPSVNVPTLPPPSEPMLTTLPSTAPVLSPQEPTSPLVVTPLSTSFGEEEKAQINISPGNPINISTQRPMEGGAKVFPGDTPELPSFGKVINRDEFATEKGKERTFEEVVSKDAFPKTPSFPSGESGAKEKKLSIESLLTGGGVATPAKSFPSAHAVSPADTPPLKFNLAALHASPVIPAPSPASATPLSRPDTFQPGQNAAEEAGTAGKSLAERLFPGGEEKKSADSLPSERNVSSTPPGIASQGEEKKKMEWSGKRTMLSDLLSRETPVTPPTPLAPPPAPLPVAEPLPKTGEPKEETEELQETVVPVPVSLFQDDPSRRVKMKRMIGVALGIVLVVAILAGGFFVFQKFRAPDPRVLLEAAFPQFFSVTSFSYKGQMTTDLVLSPPASGTPTEGTIKFSLQYGGALGNGANGYGDGVHKFSFDGGWEMGDSFLSTNIESDLRVIGNALYFHLLSSPENELDPTLFQENWLNAGLADIAQELMISGVAAGSEEYGSFGGTSKEQALNTLLGKALPVKALGDSSEEMVDSVETVRIHVVADPDRMTDLVRALYQKYMNEDLTLSEDQLVRLKGALGKFTGDVWVNKKGGMLVKIVLSTNFDDDIVNAHVKGPASIEFSFSDVNIPVSVEAPTTILTLPELKIKLDEAQKRRKMRTRDQVKVNNIVLLAGALKNYQVDKGRYPKALTDLYGAGKLTDSSIDAETLKAYFYRSYQKAGVVTKEGACLTTGKVCAFYHLGVNLEDVTNTALQSDADETTAILGEDISGCGEEKTAACYDVTSTSVASQSLGETPPSITTLATPTSTAPAATSASTTETSTFDLDVLPGDSIVPQPFHPRP